MKTKTGEWIARVFGDPPTVLIQDDEGNLYHKEFTLPDIYAIAIWIRNRPGVYRMTIPDPLTDQRQTRKYIEYRFAVFPF